MLTLISVVMRPNTTGFKLHLFGNLHGAAIFGLDRSRLSGLAKVESSYFPPERSLYVRRVVRLYHVLVLFIVWEID